MKKVRIKNFADIYPQYEGKIGIVTSEEDHIWKVTMPDGERIMPYSPSLGYLAQCELISESEVITEYQIY
jgi:hypothetical protein